VARLIWTKLALEHFERLLDYISADSPIAACRFGEKLMAKVDLLQAHPNLGAHVPEDESRSLREILQGNYRILYRVEGDVVYLVALHHAARLLDVDKLS
jgi:toxin ParE1/3/4